MDVLKNLLSLKLQKRAQCAVIIYTDHKFCKNCSKGIYGKISDRILRRRICFGCYSIIEFSKLEHQSRNSIYEFATEDEVIFI